MGKTIIERLDEGRVVRFNWIETGVFEAEENCDGFFFVRLTATELLQLAEELRALALS